MRLRSILAALLVGPSLLACSVLASDTATSESDHTAGDPTFAQFSWLWSDETEAEFKKNAQDTSSELEDPAEFLPVDHPMTQRMQFWVDRLDEALRTAHPEALRGTPRPRMMVRKTAQPNAWVSGIPIAWNVKTRHADGVDDAGADSGFALTDAADAASEGGLAPNPDAGVASPIAPPTNPFILLSTGRVWQNTQQPFARSHTPQQLGELLKFHNDGFAKCRLTKEGDVVVLGKACKRYPGVIGERSDALTYYATGKFITITTGYLLALLDEDRIVSTLAHELGHFYRSHVNMPSDVLNYFYVLDENAHTHKPPADPRSLAQTLALREKLHGDDEMLDFTEENQLITEKGLGFYTTEQEADEIAIELLAKIGVPGGVLIDKLLVVQKMFDAFSAPGEVKWAECSALRERGFKDEAGKSVNVAIGDLADPHHSNCFRAQNVAREIQAHKYTLGARPVPPGDDWSRIITRMSAEVDPPPAVPVAPPAPTAPGPSSTAPPGDAGPPPAIDGGR